MRKIDAAVGRWNDKSVRWYQLDGILQFGSWASFDWSFKNHFLWPAWLWAENLRPDTDANGVGVGTKQLCVRKEFQFPLFQSFLILEVDPIWSHIILFGFPARYESIACKFAEHFLLIARDSSWAWAKKESLKSNENIYDMNIHIQ